jgi:hypothetical protein
MYEAQRVRRACMVKGIVGALTFQYRRKHA